MMNKYIFVQHKYSDIDAETIEKIKAEKLPLVCISGNFSNSGDFLYLVSDGNSNIRAWFIEKKYAIEYAEFISN